MKKIIIAITIFLIVFSVIFLNLFSKEEKEIKEDKNISIILETEEGNLESNTFPNKDFYEYSNIVCENTNDEVVPRFNNETWKLNLIVEEKSIDGNFNCVIYFKHTPKVASDYIISKYTENNDEGLIRLNQPATVQTPSLTEYRYSGSNDDVKNYVNFNNETWRIIGVFRADDGTGNIENRVKIIREESIGNYSWDSSQSGVNNGYGINQWGSSGDYEGADLMRLLNPGYESESINNSLYWNRGSGNCYNDNNNATISCDFTNTGLTEESKKMIYEASWYTAAANEDITASESYAEERGNITGLADAGVTIKKTVNWIGKVGLMYPSDYGYTSSGCRNGEQTLNNYNDIYCTSTNWLYKNYYEFLLGPRLTGKSTVRLITNLGWSSSTDASGAYSIRPTLYLSSLVKIVSGTGTISDPYILSL